MQVVLEQPFKIPSFTPEGTCGSPGVDLAGLEVDVLRVLLFQATLVLLYSCSVGCIGFRAVV